MAAELTYAADLFDHATAVRMTEWFLVFTVLNLVRSYLRAHPGHLAAPIAVPEAQTAVN